MFYAIQAYSRARNQTQREMSQDELQGRPITNRRLAEQMAESFAQRLNQRGFLRTADWQPRVEEIDNTAIRPL